MKRPKSHSHLAACLACAAAFPAALIAQATDATWSGALDQDWNKNGNWTYNAGPNVFPNAIDTIARFQGAATGTVTLNQDITIGHLSFTSGAYTIAPGGLGNDLFFSVSSGNATISSSSSGNVTVGQDDSFVNFASPLVIANTGSGILAINGFSGTADLTISQGAVQVGVNVPSTTIGTLTIESSAILQGDSGQDVIVGGLTGSGTLELASEGGGSIASFVVNSSGTTTFSGTITTNDQMVSSSLFKAGSGTLILTGANNLSTSSNQGVLAVEGGILSVSSLSNLGNPDQLLVEGSTLQVTGNSPFTYANSVQVGVGTTNTFDIGSSAALTLSNIIANGVGVGTGSLTKAGGGTLTLSNANTYTGATTVNAGQLNVTGSIVSAAIVNGGFLNVTGSITNNVTVNSGGTLKGTGTVQNVTAASGGIVAPGTSIGTLTVNSDLSMTGSILSIEISPSAASKVEVTGQALLTGPTVQVVANPGSYGNSGQYEILTAAGGVTGAFLSATGNLSGYTFSLTHDANSVFLNYMLAGFMIPTEGITGNAASWRRYLERNVPLSQATELLSVLSGETLQHALESSSPQRNALAPFAAQNALFGLGKILTGHLANHRFFQMKKPPPQSSVADLFIAQSDTGLLAAADGCCPGSSGNKEKSDRYSFWIGGFGQYAHQDAQEQNPAFKFISGGGLLAFDFYEMEHNLFGFGGGGAYTHLIQDNNAGSAKIEYGFANVYDTLYGLSGAYLEFALWGVYNKARNRRNISFPGFSGVASANIRSWQLVPHIGVGYQGIYENWAYEPFAQFDLAINWQESFHEQGAGPFNTNQQSVCSQFLRSEAGFRFYYERETYWGGWMLKEKLSYVNKKTFNTGQVSTAIVGTTALFSVESFRNTQNLGSLGLEILWRFQKKKATLSLAYNGEFGSQYLSQEGIARFSKDF